MAGSARVFISYSSKDTAIVNRLQEDLKRAGVAVWLDHEQLIPGTHNWTLSVRRGIEQATDMVYAASPDAADSEYVGHELAIAKDEGKRILAFWIRGEKWSRCAPMGYYYAQYIDGRGATYPAGLADLFAALGAASIVPVPDVPAASTHASEPQPQGGRIVLPGQERPAAVPSPQPRFPLPDVPARLASLGFRGVNPQGTPAIVPPLVSVAAGPFLMGSDKNRDEEAYDSETPQHRVELAAFQIGKYPVTVAEYALAVQAQAVRQPPAIGDVTWQTQLQRLDHPVVCISRQDAQAYIGWLRTVTREPGWRLPTEAEWEKAARWDARANVSRIYPWGDAFDQTRCNTSESGINHTTPVGSYPASDARSSGASPWGAEDMAGNVWEWTSSLYMSYPYTLTDGREERNSTSSRVLRGGSWDGNASDARAVCRYYYRWNGLHLNGFRLASSRVVAGAAGD